MISWHNGDREHVIVETRHGLSLSTKVISLATLYSYLNLRPIEVMFNFLINYHIRNNNISLKL